MSNDKIDLVVLWVDGNDTQWQNERSKYHVNPGDETENSLCRYRDYDLMEFFFRGIDKHAPWINKLFFVTWGHVPKFLKTDHPKLKIVNHEDFIPKEYLPTFNSNVIELNLHRIKDLSENFILFNDDCYIIDSIKEKDFFYNNVPCDKLASKTMVNYRIGSSVYYAVYNNMGIINKNFYGYKPISKWISPQYELKVNIENAINMLSKRYSAFDDFHYPLPHKKSTYQEVWEKEYDELDRMCKKKFRTPYDFSHWLMRYWRLASGKFKPSNVTKIGCYTEIAYDLEVIIDSIENKKGKILIINDTDDITDEQFSYRRQKIREAFEKILPEKSSYEV